MDEKQAIFTAFWDNYHPQNAEKVFLWVARFIQFNEPLSSDGIMPPGSFWVKSKFCSFFLPFFLYFKPQTPSPSPLLRSLLWLSKLISQPLPPPSPKKSAFFVNLAVKTKLHLDAPDDPDSTWPDLQGFFDTFPQKHPFHHKVHISDFKIRTDPKTIRHSHFLYGPPTPDDDSVVVVHSAAAKTAAAVKNGTATATANTTTPSSSARKVVKEPASSTRHKRQRLSSTRSCVREMSSLSNMMEPEGEICGVSSSSKTPIEQSSYQQGRINKIEKDSIFEKMSITDYVLQSDTVQTMLLNGES